MTSWEPAGSQDKVETFGSVQPIPRTEQRKVPAVLVIQRVAEGEVGTEPALVTG
jgi:hypothetical protein